MSTSAVVALWAELGAGIIIAFLILLVCLLEIVKDYGDARRRRK